MVSSIEPYVSNLSFSVKLPLKLTAWRTALKFYNMQAKINPVGKQICRLSIYVYTWYKTSEATDDNKHRTNKLHDS